MADRDLSQAAALVLRRKSQPDLGSGLPRDQGIAIVAEAMHRKRRQAALRRVMVVGSSSMAAVAALAALWFHGTVDAPRHAPGVTDSTPNENSKCLADKSCEATTVADSGVALASGERFAPGAHVETALGERRELALNSGTRLRVAGGSGLKYEQGGVIHRFSISRGHTEFSVVKQSAKERFLVNTPDAEIEVHGTVFDVALSEQADSCGHMTAVTVSEGIVEVRSAGQRAFVTAGNHWPNGCSRNQEKSRAGSAAKHKVQLPLGAGVSSTSVLSTPSPAAEAAHDTQSESMTNPSSLALQNELFARATRALRRGSYGEAIVLYEELAAKYPGGPLDASAAAAKLRARELARKAK